MTASRRKSILLVANWDSDVGYAWWLMESFWVALSKQYSKNNNVLLAYPSVSQIPTAIRNAPVTVVKQTFGSNLIDDCCFLKKNSVSAIYFSDRNTFDLRYLAYRLCGTRLIIVHDHAPGVRPPSTGLKRLIKSFLHRFPGLSADGLIGATDYVKGRFLEVSCAPAHRCHSAPNGLPERLLEQPTSSIRKELGIPDETPLAVMTGRANEYKNVSFVLASVARLAKNKQKLHFLFCGDGPKLSSLQEEALSLGIASDVTFAGKRSDVPQILSQCDFAIHPSRGEVGYSLSILEYMQAGLPVVVPDNPSVCGATLHGKTGMIYNEDDLESFTQAITWLAHHPDEAAAMGKNASAVVSKQFNLKNTHAALLHAFELIDRNNILKPGGTQ